MEKYNEEVALLIGQTGPLNGQRWSLTSPIVIGRDSDCEIVVADRQVSRHHAKFTPSHNGVLLEDLGSKNGTHWNGKPIYEAIILQDGDSIQIALAQEFVFLSSDATVPLDISAEALQTVSSKLSKSGHPGVVTSGRLRLESFSRRVWILVTDETVSQQEGKKKYVEKEVLPPLSVLQFRLLQQLYENPGQVLPRMELITAVWGEEQAVEVSEQALDALVKRLRDRLANVDPNHKYVLTVRGHGLRLDNPPISD